MVRNIWSYGLVSVLWPCLLQAILGVRYSNDHCTNQKYLEINLVHCFERQVVINPLSQPKRATKILISNFYIFAIQNFYLLCFFEKVRTCFYFTLSSLHWVIFMLFALFLFHWSIFRLYLLIVYTSLFFYWRREAKPQMSTITRTLNVATQFVFWMKTHILHFI